MSSPDSNNINSLPYHFALAKNNRGEEVPVFPYVVSLIGHLDLEFDAEKRGHALERIRRTVMNYLDQVVNEWARITHKKCPLILMFCLTEKFPEMIDALVAYQGKHPNIRLMGLLPSDKQTYRQLLETEDERSKFDHVYAYFDPEKPENADRYVWELGMNDLSERRRCELEKKSLSQQQTEMWNTRWRRVNETAALHSHLMIVLWKGLNDEYDKYDQYGDSISWIVRFKIEGYAGVSLQEDVDVLTYAAIGPVLHIQTDQNELGDAATYLNAYYYCDDDEITEEDKGCGERFLKEPQEFPELSKIRWYWYVISFFSAFLIAPRTRNLVCQKGMYNNLYALGRINNDILSNKYKGKETSKEFFLKESEKDLENSLKNYDTNQEEKKEFLNRLTPLLSELDVPEQQLANHYLTVDYLADYYKKKTQLWIVLSCFWIGLLLFSYLLCSVSDEMFLRGYEFGGYEYVASAFQTLSEDNPIRDFNAKLATSLYLSPECFSAVAIWFGSILGAISFIGVIVCLLHSLFRATHYKYHQFRSLAECLRIQLFWRLAGMKQLVSDNFRSHQIPQLDWLRIALNGLDVSIPAPKQMKNPTDNIKVINNIKVLDKIWVEVEKSEICTELDKRSWRQVLRRFFPDWLLPKLARFSERNHLIFQGVLLVVFFCGMFWQLQRIDNLVHLAGNHNSDAMYSHWIIVKIAFSLIIFSYGLFLLYRTMSLRDRERRMREQLRTPFAIADYVLDTIGEKKDNFHRNPRPASPKLRKRELPQKNLEFIEIVENDIGRCQEVLRQLGQEVLAKRADWLLAATERDLKSPR